MSKKIGTCALCGKMDNLTFEHIPPKAAFNSFPSRPVTGDKIIKGNDRMPWDTDGLKYSNLQQGMGKYCLCAECNNNTGTWYGNDYIKVAKVLHHILESADLENIKGIGIKQVHPLRFIKQVISMFCSINNFDDNRIIELRKFVLEKDAVSLNKAKYKINMYITRSNLMKYAPLSGIMMCNHSGIESIVVSEITAYPMGFILYFDPSATWSYEGFDITSFAELKYNDLADIEIPLCVQEMNDVFPTFLRSKEEIKKCIELNREKDK